MEELRRYQSVLIEEMTFYKKIFLLFNDTCYGIFRGGKASVIEANDLGGKIMIRTHAIKPSW